MSEMVTFDLGSRVLWTMPLAEVPHSVQAEMARKRARRAERAKIMGQVADLMSRCRVGPPATAQAMEG